MKRRDNNIAKERPGGAHDRSVRDKSSSTPKTTLVVEGIRVSSIRPTGKLPAKEEDRGS